MSAIPGGLDTERQPPMTVPLRHFVIGLGFLLVGVVVGTGLVTGTVPGLGTLAHVHLLLAGWVCITIMGAMTQFVPVWSGTSIHSQRLASVQLTLVTTGLLGFVLGLLLGEFRWLGPFGILILVGFWTFVYNVGRTLATVDGLDVTERHFVFSLLFFLVLTTFGVLLAVDLARPILPSLSVSHENLLGAHATLAVFGAVLTTVYGALYQLGTMFTQTELHGIDNYLRPIEEVGHPVGVVLLATGRLVDGVAVARIGGLLILVAALSFGLVLARKLYEMQVEWTPMHSRYTVVTPALVTWALLSIPAWLDRPTAREHLFGASGSIHLLVLGVVGFVVVGTLYHIVPFIIWVHRYSDLLGFEDVPMIDDLYDDRLAATDFVLLLVGTAVIVVSDVGGFGSALTTVGGISVGLGVVVFTTNVLLVIREHSPHSLDRVVLGSMSPRRERAESDETMTPDRRP
ncbi:hypothetical protein [Halorussus salinisoli]|uniref:hypothetical protein n=1 Tax=Halorussus salinisoli TaxID=2558242 RepID=UPI0010C1E3EE|nr:hypothetical protein [Halorussus salinisoli]